MFVCVCVCAYVCLSVCVGVSVCVSRCGHLCVCACVWSMEEGALQKMYFVCEILHYLVVCIYIYA